MQIKVPRGTYDILPPQSSKWHYLEKILRETAEVFGYREIRTPIFEHTELFERGVGESTDIVSKEMYTFADKSERSLTLRPEGTASCARALIEHSAYSGLLPVKWYYMGPMFRYDRPETGRYRQFHQFGVEAFGSLSPYMDAEVIILLVEILHRLGLKDYELHLNSVGCPKCRRAYREKLISHIKPVKDLLCPDCQGRYEKNPLRVLDCKNEACHAAIKGYPVLYDSLCDECREHYAEVRKALSDNQVSYIHDDNLVRGLDYYTNTAFEVHIPGIGAQSAVGGGGRYNGLVKACGGPDIGGVGFALGMERLLLALAEGEEEKAGIVDVFVAVMDRQYEDIGVKILTDLRRAGIKADKDYTGKSPKGQMKHADKLGVKMAILLGEDEVKNSFVTVRDMISKEQYQVGHRELIDFIKRHIKA
ncbi:histidyl-tRNA synthetase [Thermosyntropha lipolytica DSM 11003]|uniref:Histidine--tRNA ligase n=1 Tax=Thermosyntropha lipolytica DSM 11003 TaxID=1123382 RepID=A0A1M5P074_9FIRM|nr:histidine--tRNA ligase [Thermosyntropha lipolytica]SHG95105.1 histidyl-tRNA synthetase [Thermosyntropha lipolytica DSM 11003]